MKVNESDVLEIVKEADVLVDMAGLKMDISLTDQGVDSLDLVNVFLLIEEKFDIKIPDEDLDSVQSIEQMVKYINSK